MEQRKVKNILDLEFLLIGNPFLSIRIQMQDIVVVPLGYSFPQDS